MAGNSAVAKVGPSPLLLWSTNPRLKYFIHQRFYDDVHYVWCSATFEAAVQNKYVLGSLQPPSSDPKSIYRTLRAACDGRDDHDPKIDAVKKSLLAVASKNHSNGSMSKDDLTELAAIVNTATYRDWEPLIYVIPYQAVSSRVVNVPREERASHAPEFRITDLKRSEFEIIEP